MVLPVQNSRQRIEILERKIATLERMISTLSSSVPQVERDSRQVRLAKTVEGPVVGGYPVDANSNFSKPVSFWVEFQDFSIPGSGPVGIGNGPSAYVNYTSRTTQAAGAQASAVSVDGQYYPENTIVVVLTENENVLIIGTVGSYKPFIHFELTANLTHSDSFGTGTILSQIGPFKEQGVVSGGVTLQNWQDSSGSFQYSGVIGDKGVAVWDYGTNYWIFDIEC